MNITTNIGDISYDPHNAYIANIIVVCVVLYFVCCCCCICICPTCLSQFKRSRIVAINVSTATQDRHVQILDVIAEIIPAHLDKV